MIGVACGISLVWLSAETPRYLQWWISLAELS